MREHAMHRTRAAHFGALLLFGAASQIANAADASGADKGPNYTYLEADYVYIDIDDFNADGDAAGVQGSIAVTDLLHLFANYVDGNVDGGGVSVDVTQYQVGAGLNIAMTETVDFVGRASWVHLEADARGINADDDGYQISAGVRAMIAPAFELNGDLSYTDMGDSDQKAIDLGAV
jgi:hypothetical protein